MSEKWNGLVIEDLRAKLTALEADNAILRDVAEKYADKTNWDYSGGQYYDIWKPDNRGYTPAQEAIAKLKAGVK